MNKNDDSDSNVTSVKMFWTKNMDELIAVWVFFMVEDHNDVREVTDKNEIATTLNDYHNSSWLSCSIIQRKSPNKASTKRSNDDITLK